ncbi:MAG TPA: type II secretion system protein [Gemmatimonadaceae bacterium]|nr:type II secretion system protein [Gemmatimonadaceae bacterium]
MSLLESLVSLVILAISAVGFLGTFQQSARAVSDADRWLRASQIAEAATEAHKAGAALPPNASGYTTTVTEAPLPSGLVDVAITVTLPNGQHLTVHRMAPQ